jgi:hypothetical protein
MTFQTSVQNPAAIRLGSCKLEVEDHPGAFASMTDVGILKGAKLTVNRESITIQPDNAPEVDVSDQITGAEVTATLHEWTLATLEKLGLGTVTTVTGDPVNSKVLNVASGAWDYSTFIPVTDQPSATIASVAGSTNPTLVVGTDYHVITDDEGVTGIVVLDSQTVTTTAQALTITYDYTPIESKTIKLGGKGSTPKYIAVQMTNTNAAGKKYRYRLFKVKLSSNFEHTFTADSGGEPAGIPITLTARPDPTLPDDENVIQIYDEQAV